MSSQTVSPRAKRERGLGYAFAGALGITLVAMLIGGALFAWLLSAASGPSAAELLPPDVQLYAATTPNVGGVVEVSQLRDALRQGFGVATSGAMLDPLERRLGVSLRNDVVTWLGSEIIVAARGATGEAAQGDPPATALLRDGELLLVFGSKNDPQAEAFLRKHAEARRAAGETIAERTVGETVIFEAQNGAPSPLAAFGLVNHYVVFSNSTAALEALARRGEAGAGAAGSLAALPAFQRYRDQVTEGRSVTVYTDGSNGAELARAAVRDIINELAE
jgi:hypothetical protein